MGAIEDKVKALVVEFDSATTAVATVLEGLRDQLVGAITPEDVDALMRPSIDRLKILGTTPTIPADPNFPVA